MFFRLTCLEKDWTKIVNAGGEGHPFSMSGNAVVPKQIAGSKRSSSRNGESDDESNVSGKGPAPPINDIYRARQQKRVK